MASRSFWRERAGNTAGHWANLPQLAGNEGMEKKTETTIIMGQGLVCAQH